MTEKRCLRHLLSFLLISLCMLAPRVYAVVDHLEVSTNRQTTVPGIDAVIRTQAFDAMDNPEAVFAVTYSIVEGVAGGTLSANVDCDGEPAGSAHCANYSPPEADGTYHIQATLDSDPTITAQVEVQVVHCAPYPADGGNLYCEGPFVSPNFDHKDDMKLAVILLEPQDFQSAADAERQQFRNDTTDRFFGAANSVKQWFAENGNEAAQLVSGAPDVYGPYVMAHNWSEYFRPDGQLQWGTGQGICFQEEGAALADIDLDYGQYNRVYFVVKGDAGHNVWGWTNGIWNSNMSEGCIRVSSARDGGLSNWQVAAHEYMHTLLMSQGMGWTPDLYGGAAANKVGDWDIMDHHNRGSQNTMPIKWAGEWIDNADIFTLPRPVGNEEIDETVTLIASGQAENDPAVYKVAIIPVTERKKIFIEARKQQAGNTSDQNLPAAGVILTDWTPNPAILGEDRAQILLRGGPLVAVGDVHDEQDPVDPTRRLNVELTAVNGDNYTVRIRWRQFRADPYINPWEPPPYESVDIWNDCPLNNSGGTVVFEDTDAGGNPVGRGDQPCYGVYNTLFARIHNGGNKEATDANVNFYWVDPSIGDPPWNYIGSTTVTVPPGTSAMAQTSWIPISNPAHQCVKVMIDTLPGELNPSNNLAQENFHVQESPSGSPYKPASMQVNVNNPFDFPTYVRLGIHNLDPGWQVNIDKRFVRLLARETKPVEVTITPPEELQDKRPQSTVSIGGFAYRETHDDNERMIPIGGVSILTRGVDPIPALQLAVSPAGIPLGGQLTANVHAFPLVNKPVAVVFRGPNNEEVVQVENTDTSRNASYTFLPASAGQWTAQARFMGDRGHAASESETVRFTVMHTVGVIPDDGQECTRLCKREYYLLLIGIVLLVVILILVSRLLRRGNS